MLNSLQEPPLAAERGQLGHEEQCPCQRQQPYQHDQHQKRHSLALPMTLQMGALELSKSDANRVPATGAAHWERREGSATNSLLTKSGRLL